MMLTHPLECSATTHPGLKRGNNEDCFLSSPYADLWVVADGMGGHEAGEIASGMTLKKLSSSINADGITYLRDTELLKEAVQHILNY